MQFDPQVTITGINHDFLAGTHNSSLIESTLYKSYMLETSWDKPAEFSIEKELYMGIIMTPDRQDSLMHDDLLPEHASIIERGS